jgi:DNA-binding ferritin-like protein
MKEELIVKFITLQQQFRVLHWQTKSYARHNAYGSIYDSLDDLIDRFVEVYMGKYGRVELINSEASVVLKNTKDLSLNQFLAENLDWLMSLSQNLDSQKDSDLLNIRDEFMAEINKLRYLLSLK